MSEQPGPSSGQSRDVTDEELPEDLRPSEDNPLAEPAGEDVPEDVLKESHQEQSRRGDVSEDSDSED
jgi:hypothetical protein